MVMADVKLTTGRCTLRAFSLPASRKISGNLLSGRSLSQRRRGVNARMRERGADSQVSESMCDLAAGDRQLRSKRGFELRWLEAKRSRLALVCESSMPVNQVEAIRPARIGFLRGIIEAIDERRYLDAEACDADVGQRRPLVRVRRGRVNHLIPDVGWQLPGVARMASPM
jgi:hypothetical protein